MFFWIPGLIPLLGVLAILVLPLWPISKGQAKTSSYDKSENWKKFGIYFGVNLLGCALISVLMWCGATSKTKFPEVWNYLVIGTMHEMEWTTEESRTETYASGTDSDGNTTYSTRTVYYTDHHGPFWKAQDEYGSWHNVTASTYNQWAKFWGNQEKTGMHKGTASGLGAIDGPIFECKWPKTFETIYPWSEVNRYVNKIRLSQSVLKFGEPTEEEIARFPRPADKKNTAGIVSYGGPSFGSGEQLLLRRVNAALGRRKEVHTLLVTFDSKEPRSVVESVLKAWGGPNKNELCTFIALDGSEVKWVEVHSWLDNTEIHGMIRDGLMGEPFSIPQYAALLRNSIPRYWNRKEFTELNEYLSVPINPIWFVIGLILSVILGVGSFFIIECQVFGHGRSYGSSPFSRKRSITWQ